MVKKRIYINVTNFLKPEIHRENHRPINPKAFKFRPINKSKGINCKRYYLNRPNQNNENKCKCSKYINSKRNNLSKNFLSCISKHEITIPTPMRIKMIFFMISFNIEDNDFAENQSNANETSEYPKISRTIKISTQSAFRPVVG